MNRRGIVVAGLAGTIILAIAVVGFYIYTRKVVARRVADDYYLARSYFVQGDYASAEQIFSRIVADHPKSAFSPDSLAKLGSIYEKEKNYAAALAQWQKVGSLEQQDLIDDSLYHSAYCYENMGDPSEAKELYGKVIFDFPESELVSLALCGMGRIAEAEDRLPEARDFYEKAQDRSTRPEDAKLATKLLGDVNIKILFSPYIMDGSDVYLVQPGDSLSSIGTKFNVTPDLLADVNEIEHPASLRPGKRLKVPLTDFSVIIDKSDYLLTAMNHGKIFKVYPVGLGKGGSTPAGDYAVQDKLKDPVWWSPDKGRVPPGSPENELGIRWIGLKPLTPNIGEGYGMHEAVDPSTVGWDSSNGCPRMYRADVQEIYKLLTVGTPVTVVE